MFQIQGPPVILATSVDGNQGLPDFLPDLLDYLIVRRAGGLLRQP